MNVFEYAKKMELDGINFYHEEAEHTTKPGFKKILQLLSDEERKHYQLFDKLQRNSPLGKLPAFPANEAENIFRQLRQRKEGFDFSAEQVDVFRKALEIERQSEHFYRHHAEKIEDEELKKQLLLVADEEAKHTILVDSLVEYLNRPNDWVEHAMFSQIRPEY